MFSRHKVELPSPREALPGRSEPIASGKTHFESGRKFLPPYPQELEIADFALGCFWGAERLFWRFGGVWVTAVGYQGGVTPNPTYREVCSGKTGHAEAVRVVFDPTKISYEQLARAFFEGHDPTQGMRQGNDVGTQYRSAIFTHSPEQKKTAERVKAAYEAALRQQGYGPITTTVEEAPEFYFAEEDHQQYLAKNPDGYCGLGGTGVSCAIGAAG